MGPEKIFEAKIKNFLEAHGGWFVKFFANGYTKSGIPDILACVDGHFVAIEVKAQNGTVKPLQKHKIEEIRKAGGFAFALYPSGFETFKDFILDLKDECWTKELPIIMK